MGRQVFNLEETDEEIASKAIDAVVDFYEKGLKGSIHISAYDPEGDHKWWMSWKRSERYQELTHL